MAAELNPETGAITLPLDRLIVSFYEQGVLSTAGGLVVSECLQERGLKFSPGAPTNNPIYLSESYFGPWTLAQAQKFGFVKPASDADLHFNSIQGAPPYTPREIPLLVPLPEGNNAALEECGKSDRGDKFTEAWVKSGPWSDALSGLGDRLENSAEFKAAVADLGACFSENGLTAMKQSPWLPQGAKVDVISPEQISLAVTVVECKNKVNFTQRVTEADAKLQAVIVAKYADELFAQRRKVDEALEAARQLLTMHGYGDYLTIINK